MSELFFQGLTAILGATDNEDKFGYQIYAKLVSLYPNISIVPINPNCDSIEGVPCKNSIDEISKSIDTLVFIVNPKIGLEIAKKAFDLGVRKFWFQPGAESEELRIFCEENNLLYSFGSCILHL